MGKWSGKEAEGTWGLRAPGEGATGVQMSLQELQSMMERTARWARCARRGAIPVLSAWLETSSAETWVRKLVHTVERRVRALGGSAARAQEVKAQLFGFEDQGPDRPCQVLGGCHLFGLKGAIQR